MAGHGKGVNFNLLTRPLRVGRDPGTRQIHSRLLTTNWSARSLGPEGLVPNFLVPGCGLLVRRRGQHLVRLSCLILPSLVLHKRAGADNRFNLFQSQEAIRFCHRHASRRSGSHPISRQKPFHWPAALAIRSNKSLRRRAFRHIPSAAPRQLTTQSVLVGST